MSAQSKPRGRNPHAQTRDAIALQMRRAGRTYYEIADHLAQILAQEAAASGKPPPGYSAMSAHRAVKRALRDITKEDQGEASILELTRLDELIKMTLNIWHSPHYVVAPGTGKLVVGPDGEYLDDSGPKLAAIARLQSLSESRRKLLGLDAPARKVVEVVTEDVVDNMIATLQQELAQQQARQQVKQQQALTAVVTAEVIADDEVVDDEPT